MYCFSEKTVTPILLNKPFLVASAPNFHAWLKERGFELYDELFDYSFDCEQDIEVRFEKLVLNVKRYAEYNSIELKKVYDSVSDKLAHNRKLAMHYAGIVPNKVQELKDLLMKNNTHYDGSLNTFA